MEQSAENSAPRRLAPQRKSKPAASTSNVGVANMLPLDLSLDEDGEHESRIQEHQQQLITKTLADWTLNETTNQIEAQVSSDDDEEGQSYHGEIESHESSSDSVESSTATQDEIEIPNGYAPISLDEISTSPPPSMPLVLVDLELLCGCKPDLTEREVLISQLKTALYGESMEECKDDTEKDGEGLEFDMRAVELFESGVGSHVDSDVDVAKKISLLNNKSQDVSNEAKSEEDEAVNDTISSLATIPYPEFISDLTTSTSRLWKLLHKPHPLPVIKRLFKHLRNTSRSLFWKVEMHNQLRLLVIDEHKAMTIRLASEEYEEWKVVRKERLEKLYEVRETFLLRVDVARERYETLVEERERRVDVEMKRRNGELWEESKRLNELKTREETENVLHEDKSYDDDGWGGVIQEDDIIGDVGENHLVVGEYCPGNDDDSESNEEWSPVGMSVVVKDSPASKNEDEIIHGQCERIKRSNADESINKLQPITVDDNTQRKMKRLERAVKQPNSQKDIAKEVAMVRDKLKTTDELMAEAMLRSLQGRLDGVDNLLESLQEEEWADEEDAEQQQHGQGVSTKDAPADPSEMSLLDGILAMILGAMSWTFSGASCAEEHYRFVKDEHKMIVNEWKETFGRLPKHHTVDDEDATNVVDSKEKLSVMGNTNKDWDEVDWDSLIP